MCRRLKPIKEKYYMTLFTTLKRTTLATMIAAVAMLQGVDAQAQNNQSVSNYRKAHAELLAKQSRIKDQIKVEEAQRYAKDLYGEVEPEPDIYNEGWNSGVVNPWKNAEIPTTKVIDVRNSVMPTRWNVVNSHYGYRPRFGRVHKGVDLKANVGDTVRAAFDGKVRLTKFERGGFGFYVIVRHENGLETVYGHLSRFLVQPNQYVKAGTPIALSGNTGRSTGPHLHFETRFMGIAINPEAIFDFESRTTHTDLYTFNKNKYTESRSYAPKRSYATTRSYSGHKQSIKAAAPKAATKTAGKKSHKRRR